MTLPQVFSHSISQFDICQQKLSFFFWPLSFQGSASSSTMVVAEEMGTDLRLKRLAGDDDGHDDGDDDGDDGDGGVGGDDDDDSN